MAGVDPDAMIAARDQAICAIVESDASRRLVVAGPGTGKTFTFSAALSKAYRDAGAVRGVALTFITNLVVDLKRDLEAHAYVDTFHGYCKHLMHEHVEGLREADLYPYLFQVLADDLAILDRADTSRG